MLGAGNRDPEKFDDPDAFNIRRNNTQLLSFGGGEHFCLGHQLARMEACSALGEFAKRIKNPTVVEADVAWSPSFFRVLGKLPVAF